MKKKKSAENSLVKSLEEARFAFPMLLEDKQKNELIKGIFTIIEKLENPEIDKLLDRFPELLQKNDFKELLSGKVEITNARKQDVIMSGIVSCLLTLIPSCSELTDGENRIIPFSEIQEENTALRTIQYIMSSISLEDFLQHLMFIIISIVGNDYYENFQRKINSKNFRTEDILKLDKDPELKKHIDLMQWFALIRLFLESVYFYFNNENHNTQNIPS